MMEVGFFGHNFILIAKGILTAMFVSDRLIGIGGFQKHGRAVGAGAT